MNDCIFCSIVSGAIPARKVYEDSDHIAFLDIFPANPGHTLVIPKVHRSDIHEMSASEYGNLAATTKIVADLVHQKLDSEGMTIFQMNKVAGWQSVFHTHFHVIPRYTDDSLHKPWDIQPATEADLDSVAQRLGI